MPAWLTMFFGLVVAAVVCNVAIRIDDKANPDKDPRKQSPWVWVVFAVVIGGGLFWVVTQPGGGGGRYDDPWAFARR